MSKIEEEKRKLKEEQERVAKELVQKEQKDAPKPPEPAPPKEPLQPKAAAQPLSTGLAIGQSSGVPSVLKVRKQNAVEERKHELSDGSISSGGGEDPEEDPEDEGAAAHVEDKELERAFAESLRLAEEQQKQHEQAAQQIK